MELKYIFVIYLTISSCDMKPICDRTPPGIQVPRNKNSVGRYYIEIPGNPHNYTPGQRYNISLKAIPHKTFKNFVIALEPVDNDNDEYNAGRLDLGEGSEKESLAEFSIQCRDTIVESSVVPKSKIKVFWTAPPRNSGCIEIRGTVIESKESWFSNDNALNKILCEEKAVDENIQPGTLEDCCACQEAKYEVAFEGKWTRNTHPRHFPPDQWNTGFSEVIGASHQYSQAFWNYDDLASAGLKDLAKTGQTKTLESELKNNSENIRTIIKARGLQFPNITKSTYAVFRVDNKNHLVSLVSKIIPSPDWIVGVSNLELCKQDCSWEESRTLNLYPWDVGIDDGLGYTSTVPTLYNQAITRITVNNPNNPESPFYDEQGGDMKPIAKLHLTRQRIYDKVCDTKSDNCVTSKWSEWSPCSVKCGEGTSSRTREILGRNGNDNCDTSEIRVCHETCKDDSEPGSEETTVATITDPSGYEENPNCPGTYWGEWSSCSVTCGTGVRTRFPIAKQGATNVDDESSNCIKTETDECEVKCDEEEKPDRFNHIESDSIVVSRESDGVGTNCKVSQWTKWSDCLLDEDAPCGEGYKIKTRKILKRPGKRGKACPSDLVKKKRCHIPCSPESTDKCKMGPWSNWTPCSSNCGDSAVQIRTRNIDYQPPNVFCNEPREQTRLCRLPLPCTDNGEPIYT